MTPRPEDVALVNRAADMLVMQPVQAGYGAAQRLNTSNQLRALASRLEGEGRDAERLDWLEAHANPAHMGLSGTLPAKVCDVVTGRTYLGDTLREAIDAAMQSAPASSPQPTTTTEEHANE